MLACKIPNLPIGGFGNVTAAAFHVGWRERSPTCRLGDLATLRPRPFRVGWRERLGWRERSPTCRLGDLATLRPRLFRVGWRERSSTGGCGIFTSWSGFSSEATTPQAGTPAHHQYRLCLQDLTSRSAEFARR